MNGSFYFSSGKSASALCLRIIGTVYNGHIAVLVFLKSGALYKVGIHQAHFVAWKEAEILLRGLLHEVLPLNIKLPAKRHGPFSECLIFQVVVRLKVFNLSFRIIVNYQLDRIQHRHHSRTFQLEILTDTVLQHRVVYRALCL